MTENEKNYLKWNVYYYDMTLRKIRELNIFHHARFMKDIMADYKANLDDKDRFTELLRRELFYYFNTKVEYEISINEPFPRDNESATKVDIYSQVMMNWEIFVNYVWTSLGHITTVEKKKN